MTVVVRTIDGSAVSGEDYTELMETVDVDVRRGYADGAGDCDDRG